MDESKKINTNKILIKKNLLNSVKVKNSTSARAKPLETIGKVLRMKKLAVKFLNYKHNITERKYRMIILDYIIYKHNCKLVADFKDHMIFDTVEEFLKRPYSTKESLDRLPRIAKYFKNYAEYFCKPIFRDFKSNNLINNYWECKAEIFYKKNLDGKNKNSKKEDGQQISKKEKKNQEYEMIINTLAKNIINEPSFDETIKDFSSSNLNNDSILNANNYGLVSVISNGESFNSFLTSFTKVGTKPKRSIKITKGKTNLLIFRQSS